MSTIEFLDEPIDVTATINSQGQLKPQNFVWRDRRYTIVTLGRQWIEKNGRFLLTEAADGTRFELQLRRKDLTWRLRKIWWGQTAA